MKKIIFFLCSCFLALTFVPSAIAEFQVFSERQSPSTILVKVVNYRSGEVMCNISSYGGIHMGSAVWHHYPNVTTMLINVPENIIEPDPEVNCTITYD